MYLKSFHISGLFGHLNHDVIFKENDVTIIIAPNGYGKTICLKVIHSVFNKRLAFLRNLHFSSVVFFTESGSFSISKKDPSSTELVLCVNGSVSDMTISKSVDSQDKKIMLSRLSLYVPFLNRVSTREWEDTRHGDLYSFDDAVEVFSEYLPDQYVSKQLPNWFLDIINSLDVHLVQDQRLIQRNGIGSARDLNKGFLNTITMYAGELAEIIVDSGVEAAKVSQDLDSSFPARLLRYSQGGALLSEDQIIYELKQLQSIREGLSSFNLLSSYQSFPDLHAENMNEEERKVLSLYIGDTKEKLVAYHNVYTKIALFTKILNTRRLSFKTVKTNSEQGFYFETTDGLVLNSTELSSGEQHQVVLLFELIFKTNKNILVLIDEPEISLHIAWQKEFLNDIKAITSLQKMPIVIATHSPQIINGNWDLTVNLGGGNQ
ncbi:AAA family ATPase [Cobetia marina]|uniref:AAA family ATPase n=1 Tax=Cobetia marina TaxID=28258 RepID=UPI0038512386